MHILIITILWTVGIGIGTGTGQAFAGDYTVYDRGYRTQYHVREGKIYDRNWQRKGYVKEPRDPIRRNAVRNHDSADARILDRGYRVKGYIKKGGRQ